MCLSLLQSYDTKEPKTKFLSLEFFRGGGDNALIISTMKKSFLCIFHPVDYQVVTRITKQYLGKVRKTLIFCILQTLVKKIMDTHIGNTGLLVKIPTYILGYSRNTHMVTHAVILSTAKDLLDDKND